METLKSDFNESVKNTGIQIFKLLQDDSGNVFNKDWWYGRIMDWSMKNESFKTQMFRFVDVLPYLNSSSEVARHLKEYFAEMGEESSGVLSFGLGVGSFAPGIMAAAIRKNVSQMAKMFITGESPQDALGKIQKSRDKSLAFTADLLGEATLSETEAQEYQRRYMDLIKTLSENESSWKTNDLIDTDDRGPLPRVNISVKLTSLYSQVSEKAWDQSVNILKDRVRPILSLAKAKGVFINIDMEQYRFKDLTLEVFRQLVMENEFRSYPHFGIVIQAYLRDSYSDIEKLIKFVQARGTSITVRLVKGAYWDYETILADQMDWPIPVYTQKKESDQNYESCAELILKNHTLIRLAAGTHNVRSMAAVLVLADRLGVDKRNFEIQMLYGMADAIKSALVRMGFRVREYITIGDLIPGMAYLVRRLLENTSNESFLRSKFAENVSAEILLKDPGLDLTPSSPIPAKDPQRFYNEPLVDWSKSDSRHKMNQALQKIKSQMGLTIKPMIDGKEQNGSKIFNRENPSSSNEIACRVEMSDVAQSEAAVNGALKAFQSWKQTPVEERASLLKKVAQIFRRDRFELMAIQVYEVGKTWSEADGDVAEAIDFCDYYAREMIRMSAPERVSFVGGEDSRYHYIPRGVTLVIAPWNFPLAILTGQVMGALVTGNTCILKPAEQSSWTAYKLMQALKEAGCPSGVAQFIPGYGEEVGKHLVAHKDVATVSFTGSMPVGLEITKQCGLVQDKQNFVKRPIIEMGGKNAIIVDSDADLDEAVIGLVYSAFGFQGQKCSACSRAIVLEENYERFLDRLVAATESIVIDKSENPASYMGPVVDKDAKMKIESIIQRAKSSARLIYQGPAPSGGHFIGPTIFADVNPESELAQEEIFGPVLAVIKVRNLDEALQVANGTQFALTGGFYSRSPMNIERVKKEFECGNLYINRGNTGALVGRHPFGGYKLSGLGSKTGGKDYLLNYVNPRVITENTMRRGFAPSSNSSD